MCFYSWGNLDLKGSPKGQKDMESGAGFHGLREKTGERLFGRSRRIRFDVETKL